MRDDTAADVAYRRALALIAALVTLVGAVWAVLTPAFRAPDEPQHVNSVLRVAYGGGWPAAGEALVGPAVDVARRQAALVRDAPGRYVDRPRVRQFVDVQPVRDEERGTVSARNALAAPLPPGTETRHLPTAAVDQMTQHPPLYYALAAGVLHATGTAEARWDHQLLTLRLFDVALLSPLPLLTAAAVRRLLAGRPSNGRAAALVAASFTLFVPQVGHILGSVTNDALVTLTAAVTAYLCARVVTSDLRWRTAACLGVVVGLGLLTKVMAVFALPMVVAAYGLAAGPRRRRAVGALVACAAASVVGGWWWVRNLLVLGTLQPVGIPDRIFHPPEQDGVWYFLRAAVTGLTRSFFGNFGWLEVRLPAPVFWTAALVVAGLCALAAVRGPARRATVVLLLQPITLWCAVVVNAWPGYEAHGSIVAVQGRYLFAGLTALAVGTSLGLLTVFGARLRVVVPWVVGAGALTAAGGLAYGFWGFYQGPDQTVAEAAARWAGWSPLTWPQLALAGAVTVVVAVGAVLSAVRFRRVAPALGPSDRIMPSTGDLSRPLPSSAPAPGVRRRSG